MNGNDSLARLAAVIESRKPANGGDPAASYVARLFDRAPTPSSRRWARKPPRR